MNWDFNKEVFAKKILNKYYNDSAEGNKRGLFLLIVIILVFSFLFGIIAIAEFKKEDTPYNPVAIQDEDISKFLDNVIKYIDINLCSTDGHISIWFYEDNPTLNNIPSVNWDNEERLNKHVNDLYYSSKDRSVYIFKENNNKYIWEPVLDQELVIALDIAYNMSDTNDGERKVFTCLPAGPYNIGDIYVDEEEDIYVIVVPREEGEESEPGDFVPVEEYNPNTTRKITKKTTKKSSTSTSTSTTSATTNIITTEEIKQTEAKKYTVLLVKGTGIASVNGEGTYKSGDKVTVSATLKPLYEFSNWSGTYSSTSKSYTFTMPDKNVTLSANGVLCSHSYEDSIVKAATCTSEGTIKHTCSKCGYSYEEKTSKLVCLTGNKTSENGLWEAHYTNGVMDKCNLIDPSLQVSGLTLYCAGTTIYDSDINGSNVCCTSSEVTDFTYCLPSNGSCLLKAYRGAGGGLPSITIN